jgi:hypothetical protein
LGSRPSLRRSPLICIFRVGGVGFDTDAIPKGVILHPYRIEKLGVGRAKTNALHYEISDSEPVTSFELVAAIEEFLARNRNDIFLIRQMSGIDGLVLDVGLFIDAQEPMRTLHFSQPLLKTIADLGLSLEFSAYGSAESPTD